MEPRLRSWARSMVTVSALLGPPAAVSPAGAAPAPEQPQPGPDNRAAILVNQGNQAFERKDYEEAIELWKEAYQLLAGTRSQFTILPKMAGAHEQLYAIDHDIAHLERALALLDQYHGHIDPSDQETLTENDERRHALEQELERRASQPDEPPPTAVRPGQKSGPRQREGPRRREQVPPPPVMSWTRYRRHMTTGFILVGGANRSRRHR